MTTVLSVSEARSLMEQCLRTGGYENNDADIIADHLLDCELRGLSYGGMPRLLSVLERLRDSSRKPAPITLVKENVVSASFDGGDQVGYLVGHTATSAAISKAREHGIAVVTANNTWMTGMFSYYIEMAVREGLVAMVAGNSMHAVAPFGSTEPRFGTNPLAFGFPTHNDPIIWDAGTSNIMHAEVAVSKRLGIPLDDGMAFGPDGEPTTDPLAALAGAFTVWGGHKGSGLALVVQLLGVLAGADAAPVGLAGFGFLIAVFDPESFGSATDFRRRATEYADSIRTSRPIDPAKPVRVPFDRSIKTRNTALAQDKIEIPDVVYSALRKAASTPLAPSMEPPVERWSAPNG
jgi:LDH2 family malate/lactate/ureidoglycolate dehydrogenase